MKGNFSAKGRARRCPRVWFHRAALGCLLLYTAVARVPTSLAQESPRLSTAESLPWIIVAPDGTGFVEKETSRPFVPWGFNYDHDEKGRLIEDYWFSEWQKVEEDFREMRALGANVVRIHLQFGKFMEAVDKPRSEQLGQLRRLLDLAAREKLYLDLTGLGCYHRKDVPEWYDRLSESERWQAQARFWEAVAQLAADHPAVFCYDLMNEPVVPGGDEPRTDWLAPPFGDKHFVQFISLDRAGRPRPEIAKAWIRTLVTAIRRHDKNHLITVGLVPWSLDRPGLTSGFVPQAIAPELDFLAVHIYPERGKIQEALETLAGFAQGKPVVIEETFPLACSVEELAEFLRQSTKWASGWIGFYWGKTLEECRRSPTLADQITAGWLELFRKGPPVLTTN
ncbi:MAG: glycoside hydrolase family 5 protein [Thermoguttaceae bacterium]|nr:glycoside hydrolase family 5 protein [Thermoguttaceae bacterium]MDW8077846.1 cellulase family glycosylhydrolase [Thermoguttaceae bacterium]